MKSKLTWCVVTLVAALACLVWRAEVMATAHGTSSKEVLADVSTVLIAKHWSCRMGQDQDDVGFAKLLKGMELTAFDWRFIYLYQGEKYSYPSEKPVARNAFEADLLNEIPKTQPKVGNPIYADRESPDGRQGISYVPIYASSSCMKCHQASPNSSQNDDATVFAAGNLIAVAVITIPHGGN
jgi:hypothetical protein